ncbi:hypothetical protein [Tahibacter amnicola]|uniref:Uncharacterized protein n=1 Tax=Tahibacter amnicola TaxID=2976241 RepID=A0ABY6BCA1_9GAMM|nr:hypothetical protein [Tahibacter amnicola]UXI67427.1 hypothetical protein N4264_22250 [Tahibacter amnicola]
MQRRRIAVVGLTDDATHAFHSMLKIVDGRSRAEWLLADPEHADVLMAGDANHSPVVERWAMSRKPVIAVQELGQSPPNATFTLKHPFRVMQLLDVLDEIERQLGTTPATARSPAGPMDATRWGFLTSLHELATRPDDAHRYYAARTPTGTLAVRGDLSTFVAAAAIHTQLRRGALALPPLELQADPSPTDGIEAPGVVLLWYAGLGAPEGMAPWINPTGTFALRRWPDFGVLGAAREHLLLSAALSLGTFDVTTLCSLTGQSVTAVQRYLAACSLCQLLVASEAATSADVVIPPPVLSGLAGFMRSLRLRLGLSA